MRNRGKAVVVLAISAAAGLVGPVDAAPTNGALGRDDVKAIEVAGNYGVPRDAAMVATMVTAVSPAGPGHVTVFPCSEDVPTASNLNYLEGDVVPNLALTRIDDDGTICIDSHARSDIIVDVVGYVPSGSAVQPLPTPTRVRDTRRSGPKPGDRSTLRLDLAGRAGIPADASVVMFNLTAVEATGAGHASVRPCDVAGPAVTSSVNYTPDRPIANFVVSRLGADGAVCIDVLTSTHLVVDVVASASSGIHALPAPVRVRDTRRELGLVDSVNWIDIASRPEVPSNAVAVIYNLTAARAQRNGHATSYPCRRRDADGSIIDAAAVATSNLNYVPGRPTAATTITKLSVDGGFCLYLHDHTDFIIDLLGYVTDGAHYTPIEPIRLWDSRRSWPSGCDWAIWSRRTQGYDLRELSTGRIIAVDVPGTDDGDVATPGDIAAIPTSGLHPLVATDCRKMWLLLATGDPSRPLALHELRSDGTKRRSYLPVEVASLGPGSLHEGEDGRLEWIETGAGASHDVRTGEVISDGLDDSEPMWIVRSAINVDGTYADMFDGEGFEDPWIEVASTTDVLGQFWVPRQVRSIDIADGTSRVVIVEERAGSGSATFVASVVGPEGDPIDIVRSAPTTVGTGPEAVTARFLADGRVRWCVAGQRIGDWTPGGSVAWYQGAPARCF